MKIGTSFNRFVIEQQRQHPEATGDFTLLLGDIVSAIKHISHQVSQGALVGILGKSRSHNIHGERQSKLDLIAHDIMLESVAYSGLLAAAASEESEGICPIPGFSQKGRYLLVFDPLDGSSNISLNVSIGTIFAIYRRQQRDGEAVSEQDFLQPGDQQICAGYAIYGPSTMLVFTSGYGVHGFTLHRQVGEFLLTHPNISIPVNYPEFAINMSNERFWPESIRSYVRSNQQENKDGQGPRYNMRWIASLVAEVHRVLMRGGIFLYPADTRPGRDQGHLRLLYEAAPMAFIIEQAGGKSLGWNRRTLEERPLSLHQRVPLALGSRGEIDRYLKFLEDDKQKK
jgi:fructose-1,6-bisphosphatase I